MQPAIYSFTIYKGATWAETWTRSGVASAVGWAASLDIRATRDEASELYLGLDSPTGIVLSSDGSSLSMALTISAAATAALTFTSAYYDLKLTKPDSTVEYLFAGTVSLSPRVTP